MPDSSFPQPDADDIRLTGILRALSDPGRVRIVQVLADGQTQMFVDGIPQGARMIVQGQDFVREGQRVAPVPFQAASASASD